MTSVEEIVAACHTLLSWQSSPEQRREAEAFVTALRKANDGWSPLSECVGRAPALESAVRVLAAQTLRAQAQRQHQPPAAQMVLQAMQLLAMEAERADGRPVITQLCLAAAAAAARADEWPVGEVLSQLLAEWLPDAVKLELVALLPEELDEKRLSMNPKRRKALQEALRCSAVQMEGWARQACAVDGTPTHHAPHADAVFRCVKSWISFELLPPAVVAASPLLQVALAAMLDGLLGEAVRESATEVVCAACAMPERGPLHQLLPHLGALAAAAQVGEPALRYVRRCACRGLVAIGVAMAPDLLAWSPSAGGAEGATLGQLTAALGACSLDEELELSELSQDFWLALAEALSATAGAEANGPLLQWMVGVCAARCVLPLEFLIALTEEDGEEETEEARVGAAEVLKAVAEGPVSHALVLMTRLDTELRALSEQAGAQVQGADSAAVANLEAMVYLISMVGKPALSDHGESADSESLAQCAMQVLQSVCSLAAQYSGVPLLYRTCLVAIGTLSPTAGRSSTVLNACVECVGGSLTVSAATMRAWGRGEDHVGSVAFWRLATNCAAQLRSTLPQLAAGTMTVEVRAAMEGGRGWGGRRTDGRKLLVRGLCAVMSESAQSSEEELVAGATAVFGPMLAELQAGIAATPDGSTTDATLWNEWCDIYCDSVGVLSAGIAAAPPGAVRLLWPEIWATVTKAVELAWTFGAASAVFEELMEVTVEVLTALPRCFATNTGEQVEGVALTAVCSVAVAGFTRPALPHAALWLQPLVAIVRCGKDGPAAQHALTSCFPEVVRGFLTVLQSGGSTDENAMSWAAVYSLVLDLATSCPAVLSCDGVLPSLLDALVADLLREDGYSAADRAAGIAGLKIVAKLRDWAPAKPGSADAYAQLAALAHQWLGSGGAVATAVGILRAASGALPPWMIDNLADALWGLGEVLGSDGLAAILHEALCSELLPHPVRRLELKARETALGPLLASKDRRVFKRSLKAITGGKKKGVSGAPPAASS